MKLPWNKTYLTISFHVIITALFLCILGAILFQLSAAKTVASGVIQTFFEVVSPLIFGIFFASILTPLTKQIEKVLENERFPQRLHLKNIQKTSVFLTVIIIGITLFLLTLLTRKHLGNTNFNQLEQQFLSYTEKLGDIFVLINIKLMQWGILENTESILTFWINEITKFFQNSFVHLGSTIPNIGTKIVDIFLGFVIAIYILIERTAILQFLSEFSRIVFGEKSTGTMKNICLTFYDIFIGYLGGQFIDASIMAILFSITFTILDLPYGILLGMISGFSNIIPYFGSIVAFLLSVLTALFSGSPATALYAAIMIVILQQIDGIFIVPKVVGKKVSLHPVLVLLSLGAFGKLFGFFGLLLAVPLGAFLKTIFFWWYDSKKETPIA
ncbi:MAG: AI-2E family transporter [Bacillota bacterium]